MLNFLNESNLILSKQFNVICRDTKNNTHSHTDSYVLKDQDNFFGCIYCRSQPYGRLPDTAIYINVM